MITGPALSRLLVVGLGSIGTRHARVAREVLPFARIAALRHRPVTEVPPVVDECVTSIEAALAFGPQLAVIANPATHHLASALAFARAGIHLLVEKPFADRAAGGAVLLQECRDRGLTLAVGYNLRFSPTLARFRDLIHEGAVGRVLSVRAEAGQALPSWRPGADYRTTVSAQASLGGGVLLELSHEIDYLRWIFGDVDWVSAVARRQSALEIDVEDTAHLVMGFRGEAKGTSVVASLDMDFVRHDATRRCTVIGDAGTLRWDAGAERVDVFEPGATGWRTLLACETGRDETYRAEWVDVLSAIAGDRPPRASGVDGLAAVEIVEAARESSRTGTVIRLRGALEA